MTQPSTSTELSLNEYQRRAMGTAIYEDKIAYPIFGLISEVGEIAGALKRASRDGMSATAMNAAVIAELGDVLWYVAALANDLEITLEELAELNLDKLKDRQSRGVIQGAGDNR